MVPGNPFKIFDFANGSGSYIHLTLFAQKRKKDCANSTAFLAPPVGIEPTTNP